MKNWIDKSIESITLELSTPTYCMIVITIHTDNCRGVGSRVGRSAFSEPLLISPGPTTHQIQSRLGCTVFPTDVPYDAGPSPAATLLFPVGYCQGFGK
jgi:hypothetical protein